MTDAELSEKLTPAAQQALAELVDEYRSEILRRAGESASNLTGEVREVSVHDIFRGVGDFQRRGLTRRRSQLERVLVLYTFTGLVLGASGLLYYILRGVLEGIATTQQLSLLFGLAGFTLAAMSFAALWLRRERERRELTQKPSAAMYYGDSASDFISRWRDLELNLREIVASDFGESVGSEPLSILVKLVVEKGRITTEDAGYIRQLLDIRNRLVHSREPPDRQELRKALNDLEKILHRLGGVAA